MQDPDRPRCTKTFAENPPQSMPWYQSTGFLTGKEPPLYLVVFILLPVFFSMNLLVTRYIRGLGEPLGAPLFLALAGPLSVLALIKGAAIMTFPESGKTPGSSRFISGKLSWLVVWSSR